jgi:addiction module HigA family antidote
VIAQVSNLIESAVAKARAKHPGAVLRTEFLVERHISPTELALAIHVPFTQISGILAGWRAITGDMAMRLANYLGTSAEYWTSLQGSYDRALISQASKKRALRKPKLPARRR